jgi:hypothetical protein
MSISVETTVERDDIEYRETDDAIRYVARWVRTSPEAVERGEPPEREPRYETIPFERWARTECAHVGAQSVLDVLRTHLGDGAEHLSAGVTTEDSTKVIHVSLVTTLGRDGSLLSEPTVSFERVVAKTPESVAVTITIDGRQYASTVPVYVEQSTGRLE